jgi:hypothetical protein
VLARFTGVENRQHAVVTPQGRGEESLATTRPIWQTDETRSAEPRDSTLFKYRLIWQNGRDAGRAAYGAGIGPGDIILNYRGQWLRVLATRATGHEDTVYDGVLEVEPA